MNSDDIREAIKGAIGREIYLYEKVSSTNSVALNLAETMPEGAVVIADSQEKGRGRFGRLWVSPPGVNIYMSIMLKPEIPLRDVTLITLMSAVACATALRKVTDLPITLKWPNDLMVNDRKIGGILTELKTTQNKILSAVIGIGINVNMDRNAFPEVIKETATSVIIETGKAIIRTKIIAEILNEIDRWYTALKKMERETILSAWKGLTSTLGKQVVVTAGHETHRGFAEAIDCDGMLILRLPSGETKRISSGDLMVLQG